MQDERSMILNMLKEGKISVEEADALLGVLEETGEEDTGFSTQTKEPRKPPEQTIVVQKHDHSDSTRDSGGNSEKKRGFKFDLDLGGLTDTLRETMKGVSETVKEVVGELSEIDLGGEIFRAMGKVRSEESDETSIAADGATTLKLGNKWGDVRVTGGSDDRITVKAEGVAWGRSQEEANDEIGGLGLRLNRQGDTWVVGTGLEGKAHGRVRLDYEITLPRRMGVDVSTASGDIWIEDLEGEQKIKTLSGDITVADLGNASDVEQVMKTKSGDLVAGALTGRISMSSASGDIEINGFAGNLEVTAQSGEITVQDGNGSVQLRTVSGDISVELTTLGEEDLTISSVSGDVNLEIPSGSALDVDLQSTSGDIGVEPELESLERSKDRLRGTLNGGGQGLKVTTVSGDISISD